MKIEVTITYSELDKQPERHRALKREPSEVVTRAVSLDADNVPRESIKDIVVTALTDAHRMATGGEY